MIWVFFVKNMNKNFNKKKNGTTKYILFKCLLQMSQIHVLVSIYFGESPTIVNI